MTHHTQFILIASACASTLVGCGAKTAIDERAAETETITPQPEICDGADNDLDMEVDEPWLDEMGRYVHEEHCGACGSPCLPDGDHEVSTECRLVDEIPFCIATACESGYLPSRTGGCIPAIEVLCLPCLDDGDCGMAMSARCAAVGEELRCVVPCEGEDICPDGYQCRDGECVPEGESCWCESGSGDFYVACTIESEVEEDLECLGFARCHDGVLAACSPYAEICDGLDDDCDGVADDPFRDELGAYIDIHNCGACGVDCTLSPLPEGDLTCGGDPYLPHCVLLCEDTVDGLDPGDRVDADLLFSNGCECTISNVDDGAGPIGAIGGDLDVNCDGADGNVRESFYVTPDGSDENPGSPNYPMQSIARAIEAARESFDTDIPRPHVFVAAGTYGETLIVPEGVKIHGGYRRDFLALDPDAYQSVVYADTNGPTPVVGGPALFITGVETEGTVVEGFILHGMSSPDETGAAYGVVVMNSSSDLILRDLTIYAGHGASGRHGTDGEAGVDGTTSAGDGDVPRPAVENSEHLCVDSTSNTVSGGMGGANSCDGSDVSGGNGGDASCPLFAEIQNSGSSGRGLGAGIGGTGGVDSQGPIERGDSCYETVCCGLADFTVPLDMAYARDGGNGESGDPGSPGSGCADPLGSFDGLTWTGAITTAGGLGQPGAGGGGGGAGGGAEMAWYSIYCEYADGLGGGGGGGGAGGCGGEGGIPGTSGAPSIGILITYQDAEQTVDSPILEDIIIHCGDGGEGGRGGAGGDGGAGATGGEGGILPREERTNPSLAGPTPGAHGGQGGEGGPGGGGGGGCGGLSAGVLVWLDGSWTARRELESEYREACEVLPGRPGAGGDGGGGARAGGSGIEGVVADVLVQ